MLVCEQCGCSGKLGTGWVTVVRAEADETGDGWIAEYCPPCAAAALGRQSVAARKYVCVWEPTAVSQAPVERATL
jgi:hypothetical protein